jgi:hypothetical protein
MSDTDKTDPYWVKNYRAAVVQVRHHHTCPESSSGALVRAAFGEVCAGVTGKRESLCRPFSTAFPNPAAERFPWWGKAVRHDWYAPERAYVRASLSDARRDYNANGETDVEPVGRQHRHGMWNGGWRD